MRDKATHPEGCGSGTQIASEVVSIANFRNDPTVPRPKFVAVTKHRGNHAQWMASILFPVFLTGDVGRGAASRNESARDFSTLMAT